MAARERTERKDKNQTIPLCGPSRLNRFAVNSSAESQSTRVARGVTASE